MTGESVRQSFERSIRIARELPPGFAAIRGAAEFAKNSEAQLASISVPSPNRLDIQLCEPLSIYPSLLTDYKTGITLTQNDDGKIPIGTGAFRIASFTAVATSAIARTCVVRLAAS